MTDKTVPSGEELALAASGGGETPRNGYRGDFGEGPPAVPWGLTIAISREAGARGASIAKRAGEKLGWEVYSQDMLEYGAQSSSLCQDGREKCPPTAGEWIEEQLRHLLDQPNLSHNPNIVDLARLVLALG